MNIDLDGCFNFPIGNIPTCKSITRHPHNGTCVEAAAKGLHRSAVDTSALLCDRFIATLDTITDASALHSACS